MVNAVKAGALAVVLTFLVFLSAGCERALQAADTMLTVRDTITARTLQNTVAGAERYCRFYGESRRAEFRARTDRGKGPIVEIHCERIP